MSLGFFSFFFPLLLLVFLPLPLPHPYPYLFAYFLLDFLHFFSQYLLCLFLVIFLNVFPLLLLLHIFRFHFYSFEKYMMDEIYRISFPFHFLFFEVVSKGNISAELGNFLHFADTHLFAVD